MVVPQPPSDSGDPSTETGFHHLPVMLDEIVALVAPLPCGTFLDATLGGAGHASAILSSNDRLDLLGLDRDPMALSAAEQRLAPFADRIRIERLRFDRLEQLDGVNALSGFLFDLGVSSPQLDRADRGFSFRNDGPLDMRMDPESEMTASDIVNRYEMGELADVLRRNADERFAGRIAKALVSKRPFSSTAELADAVVSAIPAAARRTGGHPAKRTFQALRIEVNGELRILRPALDAAIDSLAPGGRGLILTYHSGEDRIAKAALRERTATEQPPGLPVEVPQPDFSLVRPMTRRPTDAELSANPRSASARLRVIERRAA